MDEMTGYEWNIILASVEAKINDKYIEAAEYERDRAYDLAAETRQYARDLETALEKLAQLER